MKPFCEVVTKTILPAMRSIITRELLNTYNMNQQEVADLLGITQAAVSQYHRQSRGSKVKLLEDYPEIMKMIHKLTEDIYNERLTPKEVNKVFCGVCREVRKKKVLCKMHEEIYPVITPCENCT